MIWEKTAYGETLEKVIVEKSGMTKAELLSPGNLPSKGIENIPMAAEMILTAIKNRDLITIFGDYDADGITSTYILVEMISALGGKPVYRLPRRFTEGYGINMKAIEEIGGGLLITVDNGIMAIDEIAAAKAKGLKVLVIDHHLPGETLPDADCIVDPHVHPENNVFEHYCGAGLSLKLSEQLIAMTKIPARELYWSMVAMAAIGTVADVMPLRSNNRWIVQKGLHVMQHFVKVLPPTLGSLLQKLSLENGITEIDIGFKVGPVFNAAGRMIDDGAAKVVEALLDKKSSEQKASELIALNESRKEAVKITYGSVKRRIEDDCLFGDAPLVVLDESISEGLVGIVTGKLAEEYNVPSFVFTTSTEDENILKGSGRADPNGVVNLKKIVDAIQPVVIRAGGHEGAAGVTVHKDHFAEMVEIMQATVEGYEGSKNETLYYDLDVVPAEIPEVYAELRKYAPFGEGNPAPIFRIQQTMLSPRAGSYFKYLGANEEHVKLLGNGFSAIGFGMAERYRQAHCPINVSMIGKLSLNCFQYQKEYQVEMLDFDEVKRESAKRIAFGA